jgi:amidase
MAFEYTSASDIARDIVLKKISPVEVMDETISRIEERNISLNAIVFHDFELARQRAVEAEQDVMRGESLGPLHGVPTLIKDLFDFKPGWPASFGGIPSLRDFVVEAYCPFAERIEAAGAIIVGKTNSPVMGFRGVCDNPLFGPTKNPFDLTRNSGGSSGGSAAAVADGLVPFAEGTDGGGSIRIPSAWCGTFGYQPSFGRVPFVVRPNAFGNATPFLYEGPITRTVQDAKLVLNVLIGRDERDPFSQEQKPFGDIPESLDGLVVGYSPDLGIFPIESEVATKFEETITNLRNVGVDVRPVDVRLPYSHNELSDLWCRQIMIGNVGTFENFANAGFNLLEANEGMMPEVFLTWLERVRSLTISEFLRDSCMRTEVIDAFNMAFEHIDLLLTPTVAALPVKNAEVWGETFGPQSIGGVSVDPSIGWCLTYFTNFNGHPSASVPIGLARGLPVGMQVMGRRYSDDTVLRFSNVFEKLFPWSETYEICRNRSLEITDPSP